MTRVGRLRALAETGQEPEDNAGGEALLDVWVTGPRLIERRRVIRAVPGQLQVHNRDRHGGQNTQTDTADAGGRIS